MGPIFLLLCMPDNFARNRDSTLMGTIFFCILLNILKLCFGTQLLGNGSFGAMLLRRVRSRAVLTPGLTIHYYGGQALLFTTQCPEITRFPILAGENWYCTRVCVCVRMCACVRVCVRACACWALSLLTLLDGLFSSLR